MVPVDDSSLTDDAALAAELVREAASLAARIRDEGLDVSRKTSGSDLVTQADTMDGGAAKVAELAAAGK